MTSSLNQPPTFRLNYPLGKVLVENLLGDDSRESVEEILEACKIHLSRSDEENEVLTNLLRQKYIETNRSLAIKRDGPEEGFVYLMRDKRNGLVKIGFSINPKYREATLQSQVPEIEMIYFHDATRGDEKRLHQKHSKHRVRGEWFKLQEDQISTIKNELNSIG